MIVLASQFLEEVSALGFICWQPRDKTLFCPSAEWLTVFGVHLVRYRMASERDAWDCDDYALHSVSEASIACRAAGLGTGHTLVYCTVRLWGSLNGLNAPWGSGHALNLVRLDSGVYVFFEPQNGKFCDAKIALRDAVAVPVNALL